MACLLTPDCRQMEPEAERMSTDGRMGPKDEVFTARGMVENGVHTSFTDDLRSIPRVGGETVSAMIVGICSVQRAIARSRAAW